MEFETLLTVVQPTDTTILNPLPTGAVVTLTVTGGLPGAMGPPGPAGTPGEDGAAQVPEILDGGNF